MDLVKVLIVVRPGGLIDVVSTTGPVEVVVVAPGDTVERYEPDITTDGEFEAEIAALMQR